MSGDPVKRWTAELEQVDRAEWPDFLDSHSGLPGPRANTSLAIALSAMADQQLIDELLHSGDEYRTFCGAVSSGARVAMPGVITLLRELATDDRWRVREGVVIGLQLAADTARETVEQVVLAWSVDPDPLIARAAVATICEPRLLDSPAAAAAAIDACHRATAVLTGLPGAARRSPAARTLRQALGYCWSVAVAADPRPGMVAFDTLASDADADVQWIVRTNRAKKRMTALS